MLAPGPEKHLEQHVLPKIDNLLVSKTARENRRNVNGKALAGVKLLGNLFSVPTRKVVFGL